MGDLISRSALIEAITQHGKDIKSDVPMIEDIYQTAHKHIIDLVEIQPTAFDTQKVVAELEEVNMNYFLTIANTGSEKLDIAYGYTSDAVNKAIDIVKKGGVECLKERS